MTAWQLLLAAVLYGWVAVDYARVDRMGLCAAFIFYALANLGFAFDSWRMR